MTETLRIDGREVRLSNPDRRLWPDGTTKRDLLAYFVDVAPYLLPHLRGRPLSFTRWPDGIGKKAFFQKNAPAGTPDWILTSLQHETRHLLIEDRPALAFLANLAVIEIHMPLATVDDMMHPDLAVIDLDPTPPAGYRQAREVAMMVRTALDHLGLRGFPKTSGATGIHIFLPLRRQLTSREVTNAVAGLGDVLKRAAPSLITLERRVRDRVGVYFDYGQNSPTRTMAAPLSPRPFPGAPVSFPVSWDELLRVDPDAFTVHTVPRRLHITGDPWGGLWAGAQSLDPLSELGLPV